MIQCSLWCSLSHDSTLCDWMSTAQRIPWSPGWCWMPEALSDAAFITRYEEVAYKYRSLSNWVLIFAGPSWSRLKSEMYRYWILNLYKLFFCKCFYICRKPILKILYAGNSFQDSKMWQWSIQFYWIDVVTWWLLNLYWKRRDAARLSIWKWIL